MSKSLLNCFVAIKGELNAYFRVIKQEDNICNIYCLTRPGPVVVRKHVKDLVKLNVLNIYLSTKEIDNMLSKIDVDPPYVIKHKENNMFTKAWNLAGQQSIFHIINPKRPDIFIKSNVFARTTNFYGSTGTAYEIYVDKILYIHEKDH